MVSRKRPDSHSSKGSPRGPHPPMFPHLHSPPPSQTIGRGAVVARGAGTLQALGQSLVLRSYQSSAPTSAPQTGPCAAKY